jgi:coenzyme F420 biosynthesis associated uncharacterized protein
MVQFVDWDLAAATAGALGKSGPKVSLEEAADAVADLRRLADDAAVHVAEYTQLNTGAEAPVRIVDRKDWAAANIAGLREVINPLAERLTGGKNPGAVGSAIGSRLTGVQAGTVLAYLSGRVLGQYEVFSTDPGQLLLIAPNIVEAERRLGADPRDFRLWVCLHEVTHRTQFTAVPWLRGHFLGEVQAFVDASQLERDEMLLRLRRAVSTVAEATRNPESRASVLDLVQTPAQRAVLDRLTALMTLLEGHAEFVMDGVGPTSSRPSPRSARSSTAAAKRRTPSRRSSAASSASRSSCASTPRAGASCTASSSASAWPASTRSGSRRSPCRACRSSPTRRPGWRA